MVGAEPGNKVLARVQLLPCPVRESYTSWSPTVNYKDYCDPTVPFTIVSPRRFIRHAAVIGRFDGATHHRTGGLGFFVEGRK
jgi:hypothetical protein